MTVEALQQIPDLRTLVLKVPKLATGDKPNEKDLELYNVIYDGVPLKLSLASRSFFSDVEFNNFLSTTISISVSTGTKALAAKIVISMKKFEKGDCIGSTKVDNFDRSLKGLGRALWETSLQLMQKFADKLNIPVTHIINKVPSPEFGPNKWDELFIPLLEKHKYKQTGTSHWEKRYLPIEK